MLTNLPFDRALHQALPNPLALAYRKAFNSASAKELSDNAVNFGLCLMRYFAFLGLASAREFRVTFGEGEKDLVAGLERPSEGHWRQVLDTTLTWLRKRGVPAGSLAGQLDEFVYAERPAAASVVASAIAQLGSFTKGTLKSRDRASPKEFFVALVEYRNKIAHGTAPADEVCKLCGAAVLEATAELCRTAEFLSVWPLKYVAEVKLEPEAFVCSYVDLNGPDWLREPPVNLARGPLAPVGEHVVLDPKSPGQRQLDVNPWVVFHDSRVLFFNGASKREALYLDYQSGGAPTKIEKRLAEFQEAREALLPAPQGAAKLVDGAAAGHAAAPAVDGILPAAQRFRSERLLGRGGMGEVWLAYDETLKRRVALKRIRAELIHEPEAFRRFLSEARSAARLSHSHIVPILTIDSDESGPYLVLEYLEGGSLRERLSAGKWPLQEALALVRQMLQGLAFAHEQGVIHRDIKPENVLFNRAGVPKLADFGLAWLLDDAADDVTHAHVNEGTRHYLAPELASGKETPGPRTDLFSLGVVFYELLTGLPSSPLRTSKVPSAVLPFLQKLVYENPNLRYDSAAAALDDCVELERALELEGRTQAETAVRLEETTRQGLALVAQRKWIDARSCFERVLVESPGHGGARSGLLLAHLASGELPQAAQLYEALKASVVSEPVFAKLQAYFEGLPRPLPLFLTAQPQPYSYVLGELAAARLVKELVEFDKQSLNLGDVGELLVELFQQEREPATFRFRHAGTNKYALTWQLRDVSVESEYVLQVKGAGFLSSGRLQGIGVRLAVAGEPFAVFRFVRYLMANLERRFKRPEAVWINSELAAWCGQNVEHERGLWRRLNIRFEEFAAASER